MNYDELIKKFADQNGLEEDEAVQFMDGFFGLIKLGIAQGEQVKISRFGTFSPKTVRTKLARNKKNNKFELAPDQIFPHLIFSRAPEKKGLLFTKKKKGYSMKKPGRAVSTAVPDHVRLIENYYKKAVIVFASLLVLFILSLYAGYRYLNRQVPVMVRDYLNEKGFTHAAVEEMVNTRFQDIITKAEEYNQELSSVISNELNKIKIRQETSLKKLLTMEEYLKKKVTGMIQPQLKKSRKNAQVKMVIYTVKKNDTLWGISSRNLKNPYNWVGIYETNGERIKNPDRIFPGQKIFIPIIKEF